MVVLGCAGSGKTRLARRLAERLAIPLIDLDALWASPTVVGDLAAFRAALAEVHAGPAWVSDGNFALASFNIRLARADLIVWLERPRWLCLWRAAARVLRSGEFHRPAGLRKVAAFIWCFDRVNRPRIEAERLRHGLRVAVRRLASDREVAAFVESEAALPPPPRTHAEEGVARRGAG